MAGNSTLLLAQIRFGPCRGGEERRELLRDAAEGYLAALRRNWQICGEAVLGWHRGVLIASSYVERASALANKHHSEWGLVELERVRELFGRTPSLSIVDDALPRRFKPWKRSRAFHLYTSAFSDVSPVTCSDSGAPIPPYLLPIGDDVREDLYAWARSYQTHDSAWLESRALEMPAYKQLADPRSDLSMRGRRICRAIEKPTGMPTFYYLMRYWGRYEKEATRPCPLCGRPWRVRHGAEDEGPFHEFYFRCRRCRLVSHCGVSFEDERRARIGEVPKPPVVGDAASRGEPAPASAAVWDADAFAQLRPLARRTWIG
jgi:predicted  nucleic acid-binding Zn ribbon protein